MQTIKQVLRFAGAFAMIAVIALMSVSCSGDKDPVSSGPEMGPAAAMTGDYTSHYRWGGANGLWRGATPFVVTASGEVTYGSTKIINPTIGTNTISWVMADGNRQNGAIQFQESNDSDYFWRDKGTVNKRNFTGWIQNPGEGKLDFRGLLN